jgi:hypothetical protein
MLEVEGHHHLGHDLATFYCGGHEVQYSACLPSNNHSPSGGNAMGTVTVQYVEKSRGKASIQRWVLSVKGGCVDRNPFNFLVR